MRAYVVLLSLLSVTISTSARAAETASQSVERLLSLAHGLNRLSPEDRVRLNRVKSNPVPHVAALRSRYERIDVTSPTDERRRLEFERAVSLLVELDHSDAKALLDTWYAAIDDATIRRAGDTSLIRSRRLLLTSLRSSPPPSGITARVLNGLDKMDRATQAAALGYLSRTAKGNIPVAESLRRRLNDRASPLYNSKSLRKSLQFITGREER